MGRERAGEEDGWRGGGEQQENSGQGHAPSLFSLPATLTLATTVDLATAGPTALAMSMGVDTPAVPAWVDPSGRVTVMGTAAARAASS